MTGTDASASSAKAAFLPPPPPPAENPKGGALRFLVSLVVYLFVGGFVGALSAHLGLDPFRWIDDWIPTASASLSLLFMVLAMWPNIIVHELGHALGGLARGMRPMAFGIGPLRWERGVSRWHFRRGTRIRGISGFAALMPRGRRGLSRLDQAIYIIGGPLANLLTAALALGLAVLLEPSQGPASFLFGTALSALFLGLLNLLPFRAHGWHSDGRNLLDLVRRSPDASLQQRIRQLLALTMAGVRPRDWPPELVPQQTDGASAALSLHAQGMRLIWAMDCDDAVTAADAARRATAGFHALPAANRPHLAIALAGHAAVMLRDRATLAAWRPWCDGGITDLSVTRDWLDAELAMLSGDFPAARAMVQAVRGRLDHVPDPVSALQLGERLDALEADLSSRQQVGQDPIRG